MIENGIMKIEDIKSQLTLKKPYFWQLASIYLESQNDAKLKRSSSVTVKTLAMVAITTNSTKKTILRKYTNVKQRLRLVHLVSV